MAHQDPKESCGIDREQPKSERKGRKKRQGAPRTAAAEADPFPADLAEQFLRHMLEYDQAPCTTHFQQLERAGLELPAPEQMSDGQLAATLRGLIAGLANMRVFLSNTDHLSDRDLYVSLWAEGLREPVALTAADERFAWNLDLLGSGSARDIYLHLKYYADEEYRRDWTEQFPGEQIPPHQDPPFDRDRHLPQPTYDLQAQVGSKPRAGARHPRAEARGYNGSFDNAKWLFHEATRSRRRNNRKIPSS